MLRVYLLCCTLPLLFLHCASVDKGVSQETRQHILSQKNNLEQLSLIMPGVYTNTPQHEAAPDDFYHVIMKIHRIWTDRDDGRWFYVEQAQFEVQDRPYRQRVYRLLRGERDTLISQVYNLPNPKAYIGQGTATDLWRDLHPDSLVERSGCAVYLTKHSNGRYTGGTRPNACSSTLAGAAYAASEVVIGLDEFSSLDRGYDTEGKQVWGSEKGAYQFVPYKEE